MSSDTDIQPQKEAELTTVDNIKTVEDGASARTQENEDRDSLTESIEVSPKQHSKKKRNKHKKATYKEKDTIEQELSTPKENEDPNAELGAKDGKTKINIERQKRAKSDAHKANVDDNAETEEKAEAKQEEEEDLPDIPNPQTLDGAARNKLYHRGLDYFNKDNKSAALKCFTACLTGLAEKEGFSFFPQCLKHMADIYYGKEDYEKAIQFIQAEKMYYETALINTSGLQKRLEENMREKKGESADGKTSEDPKESEANRAEEYENLARLCLEKKQAELALEYQGKATKLRQQLYGPDAPLTKKSLDFFTVIYAEVGKQQYSESLQKFSEEKPPEVISDSPDVSGDSGSQMRRRPSGILRTASEESRNRDRHVRFEEPEPVNNAATRQQEEWVSRGLLWVLIGVCVAVLTCLLLYLYCRLDPGAHSCAIWRRQYGYYYMRLKYLYYTWTSKPGGNKFG